MLCTDPDGPVVRHRVRALLPHYAAAGFEEVVIHALPKRLHARFALFGELTSFDAVLLLRKLFTRAELMLLRRSARCLIYELDDAMMYRDPARGRPHSRVRVSRFRGTVRAADLVLAGNEYLVDHVRAAAPDTACVLAPTPIDTERFCPGNSPAGLRIGWIGSRSTRAYLQGVGDALSAVLARCADVEFTVMADRAPQVPVEATFEPWSEDADVAFLQSLSIGLMPLTDDPWSRGKCGFKMLQYMACGVPAVAHAVGANVAIADGGRTARLAEPGADGFEETVIALLDDPAAAATLGALGREHVVAHFATSVIGPRTAAAVAACVRAGTAV